MAAPLTDHPAADRSNARALYVEQSRPVVGLGTLMIDALALAGDRTLFLVTPPTSRITYPLEVVLAAGPHRWIVRGDPIIDGLTGEPLRWDGETFAPAGAGIAAPPGSGDTGTLRVDVTTLHPAVAALEVGGTVEDCAVALSGMEPAGWGVAEPTTQRWARREVTRLCRDRAPTATTLVAVAGELPHRAVGLLSVRRVQTGVLEHLRWSCGSSAGPDHDALDALAARLARRGSRSMLAAWQPGRADATRAPVPSPPPVPLGLLAGAKQTAIRGTRHATSLAAATILDSACWVRMGTDDPHDDLRTAIRHLGGPM